MHLDPESFGHRPIELWCAGELVQDETVTIRSANPINYHQAMHDLEAAPTVDLVGRLFVPAQASPAPGAILVPGSAGVTDSHIASAQTLVGLGIATLILDPFGQRSIVSTAENQTQFSLAASALDVLQAFRFLRAHPAVDADRIAAQGTSRGGFAVLVAAMRRFAAPIVGRDLALAGVYAAWPFAGHQFADANVGATQVRAVIGSIDDWVPVAAVQSQIRAIQAAGGDASLAVLAGAHHGFDRPDGLETQPDAMVAPGALMMYIADNGSIIEPRTGVANPDLVDADIFRAEAIDGLVGTGATVGGTPRSAAWYAQDMSDYYSLLFRI